MANTNQEKPAAAEVKADKSSSKPTPSPAAKMGRCARLYFSGDEVPILDKIEFRFSRQYEPEFRQRIHNLRAFRWQEVAKATSLIFLEYAVWDKSGRPGEFWFDGAARSDLITPLCNAIYNGGQNLLEIFCEPLKTQHVYYAKNIFLGDNRSGWADDSRERRVTFNLDFLPPDCVEIYWKVRGALPLKKRGDLHALAKNFRKVLGIPEAPEPAKGEESPEPISAPIETPAPEKIITTVKPKQKIPRTATELFGSQPTTAPEAPKLKQEPAPEADVKAGGIAFEFKTPPKPEPLDFQRPDLPPPKIDPRLFEIQNPAGLKWDDQAGLINFSDDPSGADVWRIRDASEGTLIFGMPASGKTSASGFLIAQNLLLAGYGGLVMTAKTDEAKRWVRLCERFGRANDCVLINEESPHKLNFIAYETSRPRRQVGMSKDLVAFFRMLIKILARQSQNREPEAYWVNTGNELMETMFEVFLLAGEPMTMDRLKRFVTKSPKSSSVPWQNIPYFGELMKRAHAGAKTDQDKDAFQTSLEFWTESFADLTEVTRSGVISGFTSMAAVLQGRGIREMISAETTLTPESILSGKIVILDVASKSDAGQGGIMIQSAWKYLFQRAIERRADKGEPTARPVFLWEDEGQIFYSPHDEDFQPTARDCRVAHVVITQNLDNFKKLGHNIHGVMAVFGAMNTHIFHANGDLNTNKWASERIGTTIQTLRNFSSSSGRRPTKTGDGNGSNQSNEESSSSSSVNQQFASAFKHESFQLLKNGGPANGGKCEAVLLWCSHQFKGNGGKPYCVKEFDQDPESKPKN